MKAFKYAILGLLITSGATYAQVAPSSPAVPSPVPESNPIPSNPTETPEKKAEFNSPQSPARPADVPAEDTLIKDQKASGAVIQDKLVPVSDKKQDKMKQRKDRKGSGEVDTTSVTRP